MGNKRNHCKNGVNPFNDAFSMAQIGVERREQIKAFLLDEELQIIKFPSTLSNLERKAIHKYAHNIGLKSKSLGTGNFSDMLGAVKQWLQPTNCSFV